MAGEEGGSSDLCVAVGWADKAEGLFERPGHTERGLKKPMLYHPAVKGPCHSSCQGVNVRHTGDRQGGQEVDRREGDRETGS